jgi:hypothetical protein
MRNIGGRITPGLLGQLGLLGRTGKVAGEIPVGGGELHLIVLQHPDCGIPRLSGDSAPLTGYFQIQDQNSRPDRFPILDITGQHQALSFDRSCASKLPSSCRRRRVRSRVAEDAAFVVVVMQLRAIRTVAFTGQKKNLSGRQHD